MSERTASTPRRHRRRHEPARASSRRADLGQALQRRRGAPRQRRARAPPADATKSAPAATAPSGPAAADPDRPVVGDEDGVPAVGRLRRRHRVSVFMVWSVLGAAGVWDSINSDGRRHRRAATTTARASTSTNYVGMSRVMGFTMLVAVRRRHPDHRDRDPRRVPLQHGRGPARRHRGHPRRGRALTRTPVLSAAPARGVIFGVAAWAASHGPIAQTVRALP